MTATGANSPKLTFDAFQKRKRRREDVHPVVVDGDCSAAYELAERALTRAKLFGDDEGTAAAQKTLADAEAELREATVVFRLRALPREGEGSFAVLKAEHPPTDADHEIIRDATGDPKAKARWRIATFEPAVVAATLTEPQVTVEQAQQWARDWNDGEWKGLVNKAIEVNQAAPSTGSLVFS